MKSQNKWKTLLVIVSITTIALLGITSCSNKQTEQQNKYAEEAVKALKKLNAATDVGINKSEYSKLVIEAKTSVTQASEKLPAGVLKTEMMSAIDAYQDVIGLWNSYDMSLSMRGQYSLTAEEASDAVLKSEKSKDGSLIKTKYNLSTSDREKVFAEIWKQAANHVEKASSLIQ
jgi:hypothetical protein